MQEKFNIWKSLNVIHHYQQTKGENRIIISVDSKKKSFKKIQHSLIIKIHSTLGIKFLQSDKSESMKYLWLVSSIMVCFITLSLKLETMKICWLSLFLLSIIMEVISQRNKARKINFKNTDWKRKNETVYICRRPDCISRKSKTIYNKLLEWIHEFH